MNQTSTTNQSSKPKKPELIVELLFGKGKRFPIKDFFLTHSWLVQYDNKKNAGKELTKPEQENQARIYAKRDRVARLIYFHLESYYKAVIRGKYHFDSPTEDSGAIRRWIENKMWKLLVSIGEPNNDHFQPGDEYWEEAK